MVAVVLVDRILACDRNTNKQTHSIYRASIASCGKKQSQPLVKLNTVSMPCGNQTNTAYIHTYITDQ